MPSTKHSHSFLHQSEKYTPESVNCTFLEELYGKYGKYGKYLNHLNLPNFWCRDGHEQFTSFKNQKS